MSRSYTSGDLAVELDVLGLTRDESAGLLGVSLATLKNWLGGVYPVPEHAAETLDGLRAMTARTVERVVASLDPGDPVVVVYRTDAEFREAHPEFAPMSARWWRHVVGTAQHASALDVRAEFPAKETDGE